MDLLFMKLFCSLQIIPLISNYSAQLWRTAIFERETGTYFEKKEGTKLRGVGRTDLDDGNYSHLPCSVTSKQVQ
jgi:hypothetical protein